MRKRRVILILLGVVVAGAVVVLCRREPEPEYGGRKLSDWVETVPPVFSRGGRYDYGGGNTNLMLRKQSQEAIKQIGTNSLPYLLAWMQYAPPAWKTKFLMTVSKVLHRNYIDYHALRAVHAADAVLLLEERAEPIIPGLVALMKASKSPGTAELATETLEFLGLRLLSADIALMTNSSDKGITFAIANTRRMATKGRPAVPVLIGLLSASDYQVREAATNALGTIDPSALAKATQ